MRSLLLITLIAFLASCGNQKLRLRRVQSNKQIVVNVDDKTRASVKKERKNQSNEEVVVAQNVLTESEIPSADEAKPQPVEVGKNESEVVSPTTEIQPANDEEKVASALEAEKNAKRARALLIAALPGFFALIIPGVVLFVIGAIYYFRARNSQYISEKGQRAMELARAFYLIDFVLTAALVIGITGMIISNLL